MEHVFALSLLVIACLQVCRTELSGTWYSANVINDGDFSPKPISEIFTTGPTFSTVNPIVVLPSSTTPPSSVSTSVPSTFSTPSSQPYEVSIEPRSTQSLQPQPSTEPIDQSQLFQDSQGLQQPRNSQNNPPNYFLIYQQAPQTIQNYPPSAPQQSLSTFQPNPSTFQTEFSTQQTFSTFQPDQSTPQTTFSTFQSSPEQTLSTFQPSPSSTIQPELSTPQSTLSSFRPNTVSTFPSTFDSTLGSSPFTTLSPETVRTTRTTVPCNNPVDPLARFPTLRIRMVAPSGSITNINVNPTASTTTRRPTTRRTTTTRRPTTTRTRRTRRNRNSFDGCINACEGRRAPICGTPLAVTPIDPDRLKGFPSICHMACHNSFRKDQYEMLVDGRCGKLRTRIRTVDSDSKLKRVELNKAQYTIVGNPQTVLEFSPLTR